MKFGIAGLGNMGYSLALQALDKKFEVVAYNRSREKVDSIVKDGAIGVYSLEELVDNLEYGPRIVLLMISAGNPTEVVLGEISSLLKKGDIVIDAVNSHYKDSIRRSEKLKKKGIYLLDAGSSGGIEGARNGACFMVGGSLKAFKICEPIFKKLAKKDGYGYFGKSGSGHFVKMVHNGIEYAMMQALGEGINILDASDFDIDIWKAANVWNNGSIIESRLVGWLSQGLKADPGLINSPAEIGSLGTGKWTVEAAMELGVPASTIAHAVFNRYQSRDPESIAFKVIQVLRSQFGGHTSKERPTK